MTKAVAVVSLVALAVHGAFKQPTLQGASIGLALAACFAVAALMAVREWFDERIDA